MNERIRELAEQAGNKRINDYYTNGSVTAFTDIQLQKFAELVAKETIAQFTALGRIYGIDESNNPSFYKVMEKVEKSLGVV